MTIILGPVPCQSCRWLVTWNGFEWQDTAGWDWVHSRSRRTGNRHRCVVEKAA